MGFRTLKRGDRPRAIQFGRELTVLMVSRKKIDLAKVLNSKMRCPKCKKEFQQ